jgi:serine/threonine protein kinase
MIKRYPKTLSSGAHNTVVALSSTEAGKIFIGSTRLDIGAEAEKMRFANTINDLVVKFIRLDEYGDEGEILIMERLKPLDYRAFEFEVREMMLEVFEDELTKLHNAGFVHRDIRRPSDMPGQLFDNIFLTDSGLRLIDVGISALKSQVGERLFARYVDYEKQEMDIFRKHFLSR